MATSTSETDGSKGGSDDQGKTSRVKGGEAASEETKDDELRRLRLQVFQLKNIIKKLTTTTTEEGRGEEGGGESDKGRSKKKAGRTFDHRLYKRRHVLLKVAYFGWDYHGFAVQENTGRTIEGELFRALALTRLIESRETSNYHRCGRTDRGVSAWHQVVSIDVRTNLADGVGVVEYEGCRAHERNRREGEGEIEYCKILNANLPSNIQVVAWAPCKSPDMSARFDCTGRTYKYFFPRGELCLKAMNDAGQRLVGSHDFRNFCKMDVHNGVVNYVRTVKSVEVAVLSRVDVSGEDPYDVCVLTLAGNAFLWHQIRCIMSVLFLVGQKKESSEVIGQLLDVTSTPRRPQYVMAADFPLNLFHCQYGEDEIEWQYEEEAIAFLTRQFQALWAEHQIKASMLKASLDDLGVEVPFSGTIRSQLEGLLPKSKAKTYVPLTSMPTCQSLEEKMGKQRAAKRLRVQGDD